MYLYTLNNRIKRLKWKFVNFDFFFFFKFLASYNITNVLQKEKNQKLNFKLKYISLCILLY